MTKRNHLSEPPAPGECIYAWCAETHTREDIENAGFICHHSEPIEVAGIGDFALVATEAVNFGQQDERPEIYLNDRHWTPDAAEQMVADFQRVVSHLVELGRKTPSARDGV